MRRRSYAVAAAGALLLAVAPVQARAAAVTPVACSTSALTSAISAAASGDTLVLTSYCVYTLADSDGQQAIGVPLTIQGNHATIRRDPAATTNFRIFDVANVALTLDTLTVMNGKTPAGGGAVNLGTSGGSLTTTDVNFQGNSAGAGGAITAVSGTSVSLTRGTVNDNRSTGLGGAIQASGATPVTLDSVTMSRNRAFFGGGMIIDISQPLTITDSTLRGNTAQYGGGALFTGSTAPMAITGSTIADNRVTNNIQGGGGILIIPNLSVNVGTITNSTISGNTVTGFITPDSINNSGGGIFLTRGLLTLDNTRVAGNQLVGADGRGAGIAVTGANPTNKLTLRNGTTVTGNLASGRYSKGGGLYTDATAGGPVSVSVTGSHIDGNKVTGIGSVSGGVYNLAATYSFATSSVDDNIAPIAPAPGGVYTSVPITTVDGATTFTGNTPTNCLLSPAAVTNCVN